MSDTITDMAKVTQMLDAGWRVHLFKGDMGTYEVRTSHPNSGILKNLASKLEAEHDAVPGQQTKYQYADDWAAPFVLMTDDFTPEQALTRMAYKVHGEIL